MHRPREVRQVLRYHSMLAILLEVAKYYVPVFGFKGSVLVEELLPVGLDYLKCLWLGRLDALHTVLALVVGNTLRRPLPHLVGGASDPRKRRGRHRNVVEEAIAQSRLVHEAKLNRLVDGSLRHLMGRRGSHVGDLGKVGRQCRGTETIPCKKIAPSPHSGEEFFRTEHVPRPCGLPCTAVADGCSRRAGSRVAQVDFHSFFR
mmetsp:Transcript_7100/g.18153  ORF Transcript_7100/g.18153 Transcript_7100/m.18153 type:complete len:203 (+) Transcript_7100:859-1467(+)